jgi:threonine synthase
LKTHNTIVNYKTTKETIAEGIAIANPIRAKDIIHAVKETNGDIITVKEREIFSALCDTRLKGYYIEPTSAVPIAGFKKYPMKQKEVVVLPLKGHGLKTSKTAIKTK